MIEAGVKMRSEFILLKRGNGNDSIFIASEEFFSIRDNFKVEIYRVSFYAPLHFFLFSHSKFYTFYSYIIFFTFLAT